MNCIGKHTKYQPTDDEWRCPKCGRTAEDGFVIEECEEEKNPDCILIHNDDYIVCSCGYETTGKKFAAHVEKISKRKPCECCNGKGYV